MGLARPVRGLYGARALICRPLRGKVSLQWPSIKGPDVDLAAGSLPGRRCLAGRLPVAAYYMGPCSGPVVRVQMWIWRPEACRVVGVLLGGYRSQLTIWALRRLCVGLYGARALICRPPRGKVSLQWPTSKDPAGDVRKGVVRKGCGCENREENPNVAKHPAQICL